MLDRFKKKTRGHESSEKDIGPIIFSNKPSGSSQDDLIGMDAHVTSIIKAVGDGNRMIGILSEFGAGKSTLIEQLRENEEVKRDCLLCKINLWGELARSPDKGDLLDISAGMHKSFLYQFAQQISKSCGSYVNQRLNVGYRLIKLSLKKKKDAVWIFIALTLFTLSLLFDKKILTLPVCMPVLLGRLFPLFLVICSIVLVIIFLLRSELLFSSPKDQRKRKLNAEDYSEIYQYILRTAKKKHILIVFEDIDRTSDPEKVYQFLVELHRYYLTVHSDKRPDKKRKIKEVTFLLNLKPQELFSKGISKDGIDFVKLFDYTINLSPLNPVDMSTILDIYVQENATFYLQQKLISEDDKKPTAKDIQGFSWLCHGETLNLRHLKHRLNYANQLYYSLSCRFKGKREISIERCAVVAYLEDTYPKSFYAMGPNSIGNMIAKYVSGEEKTLLGWETAVKAIMGELVPDEVLAKTEPNFNKDMALFLSLQIIDSDYRIYFFNYPKHAHIRTIHEEQVYNALIYGKDLTEELQTSVGIVCDQNPSVIRKAVDYRKNLQLPLPDSVFANEKLYMTILKEGQKKEIEKYLDENIHISYPNLSIQLISRLINFSTWRTQECRPQQEQITSILKKQFEETTKLEERLKFRHALTANIGNHAELFSDLYQKPFPVLSVEEAGHISDVSCLIKLIDPKTVTPEIVEIAAGLFFDLEEIQADEQKGLELIYHETLTETGRKFTPEFYVPLLCRHMRKTQQWEEGFATFVYDATLKKKFTLSEYIAFVNDMPAETMPAAVCSNIHSLSILDGLNAQVCKQLLANSIGREYFCNAKETCLEKVWTKEEAILFAVCANELYDVDSELFLRFRLKLCECFSASILMYKSAFTLPLPVITKEEMNLLSVRSALELLQLNAIEETDIQSLAAYFCAAYRGKALTTQILDYVTGIEDEDIRGGLFQKLNFESLQYGAISKTKKSVYKEALKETYDFEEPKDILSYVEHTRFLDETLEQVFLNCVSDGGDHNEDYKAYGDLLLKKIPWVITDTTVKIVQNDPQYRTRPKCVLDKLYEIRDYFRYVASSWRLNKVFSFEPDKLECLGDTYFAVYNSKGMNGTRAKMILCEEVMQFFYDQNRFSEMIPEALQPFAKFPQTVSLISAVLAQGDDFVIKYFRFNVSIMQFADLEARELLVQTLTNNTRPALVLSSVKWHKIQALSEADIRQIRNAKRRAKKLLTDKDND